MLHDPAHAILLDRDLHRRGPEEVLTLRRNGLTPPHHMVS